MADKRTLIAKAYAAFNQRDIDGALALMTENVSWPKASEGGRVVGKEEIRAYWTRQWKILDPHVEPLKIEPDAQGRIVVEVHQVVRDIEGKLLLDTTVHHAYTIRAGLIERMEIE